MSNIVIVGGGTAGWMTALYAKHILPHCTVTVIASEEIGVLGAGESTTPMTVDFLDILKLPISEVISETKASVKVAARFTGWNNTGDYYYNPFGADGELAIESLDHFYYKDVREDCRVFPIAILNNDTQKDYDFNIKLAEKNLFPFDKNKNRLANFSINFDASLMAKYLKNIAIQERGIIYIDDVVDSFENNQDGSISYIITKTHKVKADFVFDCSGFNRLIIGKHFNTKWISYEDSLPVDKAFPFFLSHEQVGKGVVPYTNAIAMKYGWMWMTPLQHRYGCGYTFDSSYISVDEAKKEVEEYFGFEVNPPKPGLFFQFKAGTYEKSWVKNCISIGLASGFIEPLEATSILSGLHNLRNIDPDMILNISDKYIDDYNERFKKNQSEIVDFIYLHYLCTRDDTEFWKYFSKNNIIPISLSEKIDKANKAELSWKDFEETNIFGLENYLFVIDGNGIMPYNTYIKKYRGKISNEEFENYLRFRINQDQKLLHAIDWNVFIDIVKSINANNK